MKTKGKMIMRATKLLVALAIALSTTGCLVQSLHPLFTDKDLVFEPSLLGTWVGQVPRGGYESKASIIFQESKDKTYKVIYHPETLGSVGELPGEPVEFKGRLGRLGDYLFLETSLAEESSPTVNELYFLHRVPVYGIFRIQVDGDVLHLAALYDQLYFARVFGLDHLFAGKFKIFHQWLERDRRILLTARTHELQEFVLKSAEDKDLFSYLGPWHRQKEGDQK